MTEECAIPRRTVPGLLEAFATAFAGTDKVERLLYERGRDRFTVERLVFKEDLRDEVASFSTAYEMVRQHAEIEVHEGEPDGLALVASAVQSLVSRGYKLTMFISGDRRSLRDRVRQDLRVEHVWNVPVEEDADLQPNELFVVGSATGPMVRDIEAAVLCRFEV